MKKIIFILAFIGLSTLSFAQVAHQIFPLPAPSIIGGNLTVSDTTKVTYVQYSDNTIQTTVHVLQSNVTHLQDSLNAKLYRTAKAANSALLLGKDTSTNGIATQTMLATKLGLHATSDNSSKLLNKDTGNGGIATQTMLATKLSTGGTAYNSSRLLGKDTTTNGIATQTMLKEKISTSLLTTVIPKIYSGAAAPQTTPSKVGDIFIDTNLGNIYISKGTSSSTDWQLITPSL